MEAKHLGVGFAGRYGNGSGNGSGNGNGTGNGFGGGFGFGCRGFGIPPFSFWFPMWLLIQRS